MKLTSSIATLRSAIDVLCWFEEVVLHIEGDHGRIELPLALAADRDKHARIVELRV